MYVINSTVIKTGRPYDDHGAVFDRKVDAAKRAAKAIEKACKRGWYSRVTITVESKKAY